MKVLITGGSGVLGSAIRVEGNRIEVPVIAPLHHELDVTDFGRCRYWLRAFSPGDVLIHCAAMTDWKRCHDEPQACHSTNAVGAWNIAKAAKECDVMLIHVSTDAVFNGSLRNRGYNEDDQPSNPTSVYAISKLAAEHLVRETDCKVLIVRIGWLFGISPEKDQKFIGAILKQASAGLQIKAVDDKRGTLAYAPHVARRILEYALNQTQGIRHLANQGVVSRYDIAKKVLALWQYTNPLMKVSSCAFPSPIKRPDFSALCTVYPDAELPHWDEALEEYHSIYGNGLEQERRMS